MREILFKAKDLNGKWVEGSLKQLANYCEIVTFDNERYQKESNGGWEMFDYTKEIAVDPETVCQYTGLTDKNGNKIFEGDAVKCKFGNSFEIWIVKWVDHFEYNGYTTIGYLPFSKEDWHIMEVIGNIFDNPELLTK
jgi:uncharacterized phage protein (TIGR01671 family)